MHALSKLRRLGVGRIDTASTRRRLPPLAYILLPALILLQLVQRLHPVLSVDIFDVVFWTIPAVGVAYAARAAWHPRLPAAERRPWRFMIAFQLLTLIGSGLIVAGLRNGPDLSSTLILGLSARVIQVPLLLTTLMLLAAARLDRRAHVKLTLDVLTIMGGAFIPLWYALIAPVLHGGNPVIGPAPLAYCVTFALCDLGTIVGMAAAILKGSAPAVRRSLTMFLIAGIGHLLKDVLFVGAQINGPLYSQIFRQNALSDLAILLPQFFMVAAAVERCRRIDPPERAELTETAQRTPAPSALPYIALATGHIVLLIAAFKGNSYSWTGLILATLCMNAAVAIRQLVALQENYALLLTDSLTGIANRTRLHTALDRAIAEYRRSGRPVAVLAIDLNGFKVVNDTFGHEAGDSLLEAFANMLRANVRKTDTAARVGGDEFVVVLHEVADAEAAILVAQRILIVSQTPVIVDGSALEACPSIGIALPDDDTDGDNLRNALLRNADRAMYTAKRSHQRGWLLYNPNATPTGPQIDTPAGTDRPWESTTAGRECATAPGVTTAPVG